MAVGEVRNNNSGATMKRLGAWCAGLAVVVVLAELVLRGVGVCHVVLYDEDETLGYRLKPIQDVRIGGARVVINEWGVRDPRPFFERKPGVRRILVLGDAVTWGGVGVSQEDLFTTILEKSLSDCEVINAGVAGYSVSQMANLYQKYLTGLDPDLVVIFANPRSFELPSVHDLTKRCAICPVKKPRWAIARALVLLYDRLFYPGGDLVPRYEEHPTDAHETDAHLQGLERLKETLPKGVDLWIVLYPVPGTDEASNLEKSVEERLRRIGITSRRLPESENIPANLFEKNKTYFTPEGHRAVGKALAELLRDWNEKPMIVVRADEEVYTFEPSNNGSSPFWSYGNTQIVRVGSRLFIGGMETGKDVPTLNNTRWRIFERTADGWHTFAVAGLFRQREPCPLATIDSCLLLSVNDSIVAPARYNGPAVPGVLCWDTAHPHLLPRRLRPDWNDPDAAFTEHSYRALAVDTTEKRVLLLNIDNETKNQHWALLQLTGETLRAGAITFPIRACYPQAALHGHVAHVFAVGDIVEPVEEWRQYKFAKTGNTWDYVFRVLYYTWTPDILRTDFAPPCEIANVDATAGAVTNQDMWIDPEGRAYLMYTEREVASDLLRDKFFPGRSTIPSLHLAVVDKGQLVERRLLHAGTPQSHVWFARFHVTPVGRLFVFASLMGEHGGNYLGEIKATDEPIFWQAVPLKKNLSWFSLANVRAGCAPSDVIDIHGFVANDEPLRYVALEVR